jgi:transcriptional regulator with XRE-family HTH domain
LNKEEIAKLITQRRKQLNITQVELALLSELSTRQLSDIETAKVSTTIDTLSKICETLGLSIELKIKGVD